MSTKPDRPGTQRNLPLRSWVLVAAALTILAIAIWGAYAMRGGQPHSSPPHTTATTTDQPTGQLVRVVVKVDQIDSPTTLAAHIATPNSHGAYTATDQRVEVDHQASAQIVMGSPTDLKAGALLQISGSSTTDDQGRQTIHAGEIVVLTGFVPGG